MMPDEVMDAFAHYPETTECVGACALDIEHKKIQYAKLLKYKKVVLKITGDEDFDMYSPDDLGPLTWKKKSFNRKKNSPEGSGDCACRSQAGHCADLGWQLLR